MSKESACNVGSLSSIPGSGKSPGEGNGNPLQYSCLENSMDKGAWWTIVQGVAESDMTEHTNTEISHNTEDYDLAVVVVLVAQLCLTLFDPMDCSLQGSSVHGMLQVRILN